RVGHVHARQLSDHRLVLVNRAQRALAGLRLVRRVGREELPAQDQVIDRARYVMVVGAAAEEAHGGLGIGVLRRERAQVAHQLRLGQRGRQGQRARQPRLGRDLGQEILDPARADRLQHRALVLRRVRQVAHQWPPCARNSSYCAAVSRSFHCLASEGVTTSIQPLPYGSAFTVSGFWASTALTSATCPEIGAKRSDTALTDSTTPNAWCAVTLAPAFG